MAHAKNLLQLSTSHKLQVDLAQPSFYILTLYPRQNEQYYCYYLYLRTYILGEAVSDGIP